MRATQHQITLILTPATIAKLKKDAAKYGLPPENLAVTSIEACIKHKPARKEASK